MAQFIEVDSAQVQEIKGTSQKNGRPYHFKKQIAFFELDAERRRTAQVELSWRGDQDGLQPGRYRVIPALKLDRDGNLALDMENSEFIPVPVSATLPAEKKAV